MTAENRTGAAAPPHDENVIAFAKHIPPELHVAPMLHVSNREFRQLLCILSSKCMLWTEMIVDETLAFTDNVEEHLGHDGETSRLICQIGGCSPEYVAKATRLVEEYGYSEVNLNVDCPSDRVCGKQFGAILMKNKDSCIQTVQAMKKNAREIFISVKTRIGIDEFEDLDFLVDFIESLTPYCKRFYIHARKCLLKGLSPAQNRIVPPLNYQRVYALCRRFPDCDFWINGGIAGLREARMIAYGSNVEVEHTGTPCLKCNASNGSCVAPPSPRAPPNLRGCMLGRAAMDNPSLFWDVDRYFYNHTANPCQNRRHVLEQYCDYLEQTYPRRCCDSDERMTLKIPVPEVVHERECCDVCRDVYGNENTSSSATDNHAAGKPRKAKISSRVIDRSLKPVLGIFFGLPKAKVFRRVCDDLSRDAVVRNCGPGYILRKAVRVVPDEILNQEFVKTEDLTDAHVVSHIAPRSGSYCC